MTKSTKLYKLANFLTISLLEEPIYQNKVISMVFRLGSKEVQETCFYKILTFTKEKFKLKKVKLLISNMEKQYFLMEDRKRESLMIQEKDKECGSQRIEAKKEEFWYQYIKTERL